MTFLKKIVLSTMLSSSLLWSSEAQNYTDAEIIAAEKEIGELNAKIQCDNARIQALKWKDRTHKSKIQKLQAKLEELIKLKRENEEALRRDNSLVNPGTSSASKFEYFPSLDSFQSSKNNYGGDGIGFLDSLNLDSNDKLNASSDRLKSQPLVPAAPNSYGNSSSLRPAYARLAPSLKPDPYSSYALVPSKRYNSPYNDSTPSIPSSLYREKPLVAAPSINYPFLSLENGNDQNSSNFSSVKMTDNISITKEDIDAVLFGKSPYELNSDTIYCFVFDKQLISLVPTRDSRGVHAGFIQKGIGSLDPLKSKPSELHFKMNDKIEIIVYPERLTKNQMQMSFLDLYKVGLNKFNSDCCPGKQFQFKFVKRADLLLN